MRKLRNKQKLSRVDIEFFKNYWKIFFSDSGHKYGFLMTDTGMDTGTGTVTGTGMGTGTGSGTWIDESLMNLLIN